ncbi:MAG: aminoacyl-tRNA hydrolase [bacterium]|nr:aminoacyl-tRNA hydrolase [bacterium]
MKQVIVIRKDLKMRRGKSEAQAAHAAMQIFIKRFTQSKFNPAKISMKVTPEMLAWLQGGCKKIVLSCDTLEELLEIRDQAQSANLPCAMITDAGHTEFGEPTITCLAIGPDLAEKIDPITGELTLR